MADIGVQVFEVYSRTQQFLCCAQSCCEGLHHREMLKELADLGFPVELLDWSSRQAFARHPDGGYRPVWEVTIVFRVPSGRTYVDMPVRDYNPDPRVHLIALGCVAIDATASFMWKCLSVPRDNPEATVIPPVLYLVRDVSAAIVSRTTYVTRVDRFDALAGIETARDLDFLADEPQLAFSHELFERLCPLPPESGTQVVAYHVWPSHEHHRYIPGRLHRSCEGLESHRIACVSERHHPVVWYVPYTPNNASVLQLDMSQGVQACRAQRMRLLGENNHFDLLLEPVGKVALDPSKGG